jgi:hypothetical protein
MALHDLLHPCLLIGRQAEPAQHHHERHARIGSRPNAAMPGRPSMGSVPMPRAVGTEGRRRPEGPSRRAGRSALQRRARFS